MSSFYKTHKKRAIIFHHDDKYGHHQYGYKPYILGSEEGDYFEDYKRCIRWTEDRLKNSKYRIERLDNFKYVIYKNTISDYWKAEKEVEDIYNALLYTNRMAEIWP